MRTKLTFTRQVRITRKTAQRLRVLATEIEVAIALLKIDGAVAAIVNASLEG